jgi:hypothetical protein
MFVEYWQRYSAGKGVHFAEVLKPHLDLDASSPVPLPSRGAGYLLDCACRRCPSPEVPRASCQRAPAHLE